MAALSPGWLGWGRLAPTAGAVLLLRERARGTGRGRGPPHTGLLQTLGCRLLAWPVPVVSSLRLWLPHLKHGCPDRGDAGLEWVHASGFKLGLLRSGEENEQKQRGCKFSHSFGKHCLSPSFVGLWLVALSQAVYSMLARSLTGRRASESAVGVKESEVEEAAPGGGRSNLPFT